MEGGSSFVDGGWDGLWLDDDHNVPVSAHIYGTLLGVIWEKLWDPYGLPSEGPLGG